MNLTLSDSVVWCADTCHAVMMTSSNGNIFRVTGPLCGEFTGHRWIPLTKASDAEIWYFLWSASEQTLEAGDLRRHRAHYDANVVVYAFGIFCCAEFAHFPEILHGRKCLFYSANNNDPLTLRAKALTVTILIKFVQERTVSTPGWLIWMTCLVNAIC